MPLEVDAPSERYRRRDSIVIALINNMPDAALSATEAQFATLLSAAAGSHRVRLRLTHLPEVPRDVQTRAYLERRYWPIERILDDAPDALIVTGSEPRASVLEDEPYWERLVQLINWAQADIASSIWSCLAAHAAVQVLDGVRRRRLPEKRFGVFQHPCARDMHLIHGIGGQVTTPHSRWNELPEQSLRAAGYRILSASPECGVDLFVREERTLLVGFQGHPEYDETSLLKEYRRDVGRFLRRERNDWPHIPAGYFADDAITMLEAFRRHAEPKRDPSLLNEFPVNKVAAGLSAPWRPAALRIYRNWLTYVSEARRSAHPQHRVEV